MAISPHPVEPETLLAEHSLYASCEELLLKPPSPDSDIYSLGVLFFELFNPVMDPSERARVLGELRHRILPHRLLQENPQASGMVASSLNGKLAVGHAAFTSQSLSSPWIKCISESYQQPAASLSYWLSSLKGVQRQ